MRFHQLADQFHVGYARQYSVLKHDFKRVRHAEWFILVAGTNSSAYYQESDQFGLAPDTLGEWLALIIGVDRVLERFRTSLNVTGDLVACVVMDRYMPARQSHHKK